MDIFNERAIITFGEGHPVLAMALSNGAIALAVLAFLFLVISTWRNKGERMAFHLATVGATAAFSTYAICDIIKRLHPVPRPFEALGMAPAYPEPDLMMSFPSAHAAVTTAIVVIFLLEWHRRRDDARAIITALALLLIPMVWAGRVIAGHHYPIDVFAGSIIGASVSYVVYRGLEKWRK